MKGIVLRLIAAIVSFCVGVSVTTLFKSRKSKKVL